MMGRLTTHVLDTALGQPAAAVKVELFDVGGNGKPIAAAETNQDGRIEGSLVEGDHFNAGVYEIRFHVGDYLRRTTSLIEPAFLDVVPIRFGVSSPAEHYHVPLLFSPYGYSTYRGS